MLTKKAQAAITETCRHIVGSLARYAALPPEEAARAMSAELKGAINGALYDKGYYRMRQRLRKRAGLCRCCPAKIDKGTHCDKCKARHTDYMRRTYYSRVAAGLCPKCGESPAAGKKWCQRCLNRENAGRKMRRAKKRAAKLAGDIPG